MNDEKTNKIMSSEKLDDVLPKYEPIKLSGKNLAQNYVSAFNTGMNIYQCINYLQGNIDWTINAVNDVVKSWNTAVSESIDQSKAIARETTTEQFNTEWNKKQPELIEQVNTLTTNQFNEDWGVLENRINTTLETQNTNIENIKTQQTNLANRMDTLPFITLSQLGATENGDISEILVDAVNNYGTGHIIVIDKNYKCQKDITINIDGWHIYSLPGVNITTTHTLTIANCSNIRIDNLTWRDTTATSENIGLILDTTVSNAIFNRCTVRGFKTECVINDVAYVVFNDCNFISGYNSDVLVKIKNYFSELSKFNRCNFDGNMKDTHSCTVGIEIQAGVWFEFNSCDITNCETLLKLNDVAANTRQMRFTNCTFNHYVYAIAWGDRGLTSLLLSRCIFKGQDGKYAPLYLFYAVKGNVTLVDCYEVTNADDYCYVNIPETYNAYISVVGNFIEAIKFYDSKTENVKDNSYASVYIELTNPNSVSFAKDTTSNYKQINSIGFFIPKLIYSTNENAYKSIPYCMKPSDTTCRIFFNITGDSNAYTYKYQLCRLW